MIETTNLVLRPFVLEDLSEISALFGSAEVMAFSGDDFWSKEQCHEWLKQQQEAVGCNMSLAVVHKDNNKLIGYTAFEELPEEISSDVEVMVSLIKDYWGKGFAKECVTAMVRYAFSEFGHLKRLVAIVHAHNKAALSLVDKCGFKEERCLDLRRIGPHVLYAIERD